MRVVAGRELRPRRQRRVHLRGGTGAGATGSSLRRPRRRDVDEEAGGLQPCGVVGLVEERDRDAGSEGVAPNDVERAVVLKPARPYWLYADERRRQGLHPNPAVAAPDDNLAGRRAIGEQQQAQQQRRYSAQHAPSSFDSPERQAEQRPAPCGLLRARARPAGPGRHWH